MDKKYFNISYQGVKDWLSFGTFISLLWYLSKIYIWPFMRLGGATSFAQSITNPTEVMLILTFIFCGVWLLYQISKGIIDIAYWLLEYKLANPEWYSYLTAWEVQIPITKKDYWKIKNYPKFTIKYGKKDKPEFAHSKFRVWATEIIEKE